MTDDWIDIKDQDVPTHTKIQYRTVCTRVSEHIATNVTASTICLPLLAGGSQFYWVKNNDR